MKRILMRYCGVDVNRPSRSNKHDSQRSVSDQSRHTRRVRKHHIQRGDVDNQQARFIDAPLEYEAHVVHNNSTSNDIDYTSLGKTSRLDHSKCKLASDSAPVSTPSTSPHTINQTSILEQGGCVSRPKGIVTFTLNDLLNEASQATASSEASSTLQIDPPFELSSSAVSRPRTPWEEPGRTTSSEARSTLQINPPFELSSSEVSRPRTHADESGRSTSSEARPTLQINPPYELSSSEVTHHRTQADEPGRTNSSPQRKARSYGLSSALCTPSSQATPTLQTASSFKSAPSVPRDCFRTTKRAYEKAPAPTEKRTHCRSPQPVCGIDPLPRFSSRETRSAGLSSNSYIASPSESTSSSTLCPSPSPPPLPRRPDRSIDRVVALLSRSRVFEGIYPEFSWKYSRSTVDHAFRIRSKLRPQGRLVHRLDAHSLVKAADISTADRAFAEKAWALMSPDAGSVGVWSSLRQNCECFVHLYKAYRKGLPTPFQIPIRVRAKLSFEQRKALDRFAWRDQARWSATSVLNWFSNLTNPWDQGQHLTVLLELIIEDEGPTRGLPFLKNLLKGLQQIEGLQHVTEEQLSNLIATYVRTVRTHLSTLSAEQLHGLPDFLCTILNLSRRHECGSLNCRAIFATTLEKLEGIEIPLCFWLLLRSTQDTLVYEANVFDNMLQIVQDHYCRTMQWNSSEFPWAAPTIGVIHFLSRFPKHERCPFFALFYDSFTQYLGEETLEKMWSIMDLKDHYLHQVDLVKEVRQSEELIYEAALGRL